MITYTVKSGDTLFAIAADISKIKHLSRERIDEYINMVELTNRAGEFKPSAMRPGDIIRVPSAVELNARMPA